MEGLGRLSRRSVALGLVAASGLAATGRAQTAQTPSIIDIHHHYLPDFWRDEARQWLLANGSGADAILNWSPQRSLEEMDKAGIATAYLSVTSPGFDFGHPVAAAPLCRRCNEYAAGLRHDHGERFRFFIAAPLPDVDATLAEIRHGFDALGASGVGLMTNYGGRYLGDASFDPVLQELDRRGAIVHVHPTDAPCCRGLVPDIPTPTMEFAVDTGRTVASLLWSGALSRYPRIRWVFSHGGGILPMVYGRLISGAKYNPKLAERVPEGAVAALSKLYVDTASLTNAPAFAGAEAWLGSDRILFGTDYPWSSPSHIVSGLQDLKLGPDKLGRIFRDNALKLVQQV